LTAIDTICLDAGGTLVWPNWKRVSAALAAEGVHVDAAALAAVDPHARRSLDEAHLVAPTGKPLGWVYFESVLGRAGVELTPAAQRALSRLEEYHRTTNLWESVPPFVPETLIELRRLGYGLVVVSNANGTVRQAFERIGLSGLVDLVVDSGEEGVEKPDPRLFEIALRRVGSSAARTVHVGDIYHVDVVGARAAGLVPVLIDEANLYEDVDCHRVPSIADLPALLRSL
jgi:HAD superfamily hydrolase (TIGR01549 family)